MKIVHNIKLQDDELTLKGRILKTIFEEGESRGDVKSHYSKDKKFRLISENDIPINFSTEFDFDCLFVWGTNKDLDNQIVKWKFDSKEEAIKILNYINEFVEPNPNNKEIDK